MRSPLSLLPGVDLIRSYRGEWLRGDLVAGAIIFAVTVPSALAYGELAGADPVDVWQESFVDLRLPKLFNLRSDPFERADHEGIGYPQWRIDRVFLLVPAQAFVVNWLQSFKEFPPRQKPASFSIDQVMEKLMEGGGTTR